MRSGAETQETVDLLSVGTLALWASVAAVGIAGRLLGNEATTPPRVQPTTVAVALFDAPPDAPAAAPNAAPPPPRATTPPPPPPAVPTVLPPRPMAMAAVTPAAATTQPATAVAPSPAPGTTAANASPQPPSGAPPVQRLTYGQGAGRQPAPSYPPDAAADRQQGTVMVRFEVDNTGRVIAAFAAAPSPWPLLNEAAVQAVRYTWRFPPGPARIYDVSIEFKLREL